MITRIFSFGRGVLRAGFLFTVLAGIALAQTIDRPTSVRMRIEATIYPPTLYGEESPWVTMTLPQVLYQNGLPVSSQWTYGSLSPFELDREIEPGREYILDIQAGGASGDIGGVFTITAPRGFTIEIDGGVGSVISLPSLNLSYPCRFRILAPGSQFSARAGVASSITSGKALWQVGLGSMLNGHSVGSLAIADSASGPDWDQLVTPRGLSVHAPGSGEIYTFPAGNNAPGFQPGEIWQVVTNEAYVEVVPNAARTSYELKFYNRDFTTRAEATGELNGNPYVSYKVEKDGGPTKLKITRTDYDSSGTAYAGRMVTRLARTTPDLTKPTDFQWKLEDWHKEGATTVPVVETRNWEITAGTRVETIVTATGATPAAVASRVRKEFQSPIDAQELVRVTRGQTAANPSDEYYGYNHGFSKKTSGDSWEVYNYATNNRVSRVRRPFQNAASGPAQSDDLATFAPSSTEETRYTYENNIFDRVNLIETRVGGTLTSKTTVSYSDPLSTASPPQRLNQADGKPYTTATRREKTGSATTAPELVTVTKYFSEDVGDPFYRDQIHSIQRPDGTVTQFVYNRGMFDDVGDVFELPVGPDVRTVAIHGTTSSDGADELTSFTLGGHTSYAFDRIYVIPRKSTADVLIRHGNATLWWRATYVWEGAGSGQGWKRVSYTKYDYDYANRLVECSTNGAVVYSASYDQGRLTEETDATGVKTTYTTDDAGRIRTATRTGVGTIVDLTTTFSYDADGRVVEESTRGTGSNETLVASRVFDDAGRLKESYVPGQTGRLKTEYYYEPANRRVVITLPGGGTKELQYYEDGRPEHVTGSAVVPAFYTFATTNEGLRHALVRVGSAASARTHEVWTDWLGRTARSSRPGFSGSPQPPAFEESYVYDDTGGTGRLSQISRTGYADTLFSYDHLSNVTRTRLRKLATTTEAQSLASGDRITDFERVFENAGGVWWFAERVRTYPIADDATPFLVSTAQHRLTGLGSSLRGEVIYTDADRNRTETTTTVNRADTGRTVTVSTTAKNAAGASLFGSSGREVFTNGLPTSRRGFDGLTYTATYDALSRPFSQSDPRTGAVWTHYYSGSGLVERISAPVTAGGAYGDVATYTYDSAGRTASVVNARGDTTRFAYNARNQVVRRWGTGVHPASFGYNERGELIALRTFRNPPQNFSGQNWPLSESLDPTAWDASNPLTWDKITWSIDDASGLVATKTFHDNVTAGNSRSVDFTYNVRGQVATRQWARRVGGGATGDRVTATYAYLGDGSGEFKTGELREITYNDGTAPVRFEYSRAGQVAKVWDATGTGENDYREFGYHDLPTATDFQPFRLDAIELNAFYGERVFTPRYDGAQRAAGFYLGDKNALPGSLSSELTQGLTFNTAGRLEHVDTAQGSASARRFTYGYVSSSALVQTLTSGSFVATRGYEPHRDLLTNLDTTWGGISRTRYEHTFNEAGQRQTTKQSGSVFADFGAAVFSSHGYTPRGELTDSASYLGDSSAGPQLSGRHFAYDYDLSGNRTKVSRTGSAGADAYTPGVHNRYASRQNHYAHLAGTVANSGVAVSLRQGDYEPPIGRQGAYWAAQVPLDNASGPAKGNVTVTATKPAASPSSPDIVGTETRAATIPPALQSFGHDEDGNLQDDALWSYTWDAENRLSSMTSSGAARVAGLHRREVRFVYDYPGRRVQKRVQELTVSGAFTGDPIITRYLYDGWNLVAEYAVNAQTSALTLSRSFTWGLDAGGSLAAVGSNGALVQITDHATGTSYLPAYDGNGNVAALVQATGTAAGSVVATYEYGPFGELLRCEGPYARANPFRFATKYADEETGLIYYGHRYYSADLGRFINRDPIEESGGLNLYGFCGNDGVNRADVLGLNWFTDLLGLIFRRRADDNAPSLGGAEVPAYLGVGEPDDEPREGGGQPDYAKIAEIGKLLQNGKSAAHRVQQTLASGKVTPDLSIAAPSDDSRAQAHRETRIYRSGDSFMFDGHRWIVVWLNDPNMTGDYIPDEGDRYLLVRSDRQQAVSGVAVSREKVRQEINTNLAFDLFGLFPAKVPRGALMAEKTATVVVSEAAVASATSGAEKLVRRGIEWESTNRLANQAAAAEQAGVAKNGVSYGHGVSVTTPEANAVLSKNPADASYSTRATLEDAGFEIRYTPTSKDTTHHTVQLPKPVTPEDTARFNEAFGRKK